MTEEQDDHGKLYSYGGILVVGIVVLVLGIQQLSWIVSLLGLFAAGYGGLEVKLTYERIQIEQNNFRATQKGKKNIQTNQTNPMNSPVYNVNRVEGDLNFGDPTPIVTHTTTFVAGGSPDKQVKGPKIEQAEVLCNGEIHFEGSEEFQASVNRGDKIEMRVSAKHPISVQIMNSEDYNDFDDDYDDNEVYWKSPNTTNFSYTWPAKKREKLFILVVNETDLDEWETDEAIANVTINVIRADREG